MKKIKKRLRFVANVGFRPGICGLWSVCEHRPHGEIVPVGEIRESRKEAENDLSFTRSAER